MPTVEELREQADRYRALARDAANASEAARLTLLALECDVAADRFERAAPRDAGSPA